jgi:hypothetical protein
MTGGGVTTGGGGVVEKVDAGGGLVMTGGGKDGAGAVAIGAVANAGGGATGGAATTGGAWPGQIKTRSPVGSIRGMLAQPDAATAHARAASAHTEVRRVLRRIIPRAIHACRNGRCREEWARPVKLYRLQLDVMPWGNGEC